MDVVLNELSIGAESEAELDEQLVRLVGTLKRLFEHGVRRALRTVRGVLDRAIVRDLTLKRWLFSKGPRIEEKRFLQRLLDKPPFVDDLLLKAGDEKRALLEFKLGDDDAPGLGVAHLLDSPAASFDGDARFRASRIRVQALALGERGGDVVEELVDVVHVSSPASVDGHRAWFEARIKCDVESGAELWERREEIFPRLVFCPNVEAQLRGLSGSEPYFRMFTRHLSVLDKSMRDWVTGPFDPQPLEWSNESDSVLDGPLADARTFTCPDGERRVFSLHSKMKGQNKRIHFFPVLEERVVIVGHVGDKLPTSKYRT